MQEETNAGVPRTGRRVFAIRVSWRGKEWEIAMTTTDRPVFENAMLPHTKPRWRFFSAGLLVQTVLLFAVLCLPLLFPDRIRDFRNYVSTVVAPSPEVVRAWKPEPLRRKPLTLKTVSKAPSPVAPAVLQPVASPPQLKEAKATTPAEAPNLPNELPVALISGVPAPPALAKPRDPIQTGMFGDGSSSNGRTTRTANFAKFGSFDSFGNSGGKSRNLGAGSVVQQGLFSDGRAPASARKPQAISAASGEAKPVEILFRPRPQYTSEAVAKKIEGVVLVEVQFLASGQITVLRVVRGLGYGLDESAEAAARQIRFKPAQNGEGLPIDSTAVVHIVFELAY